MTNQQTEKYFIQRKCTGCGQMNELEVSKREAAFELVNFNNLFEKTCNNCKSENFIIYLNKPEFDLELLKEWAMNPELYLMEQDEDLLLADGKYLEQILSILDNEVIPESKRNTLVGALCVIIFDNSDKENNNVDTVLKNRVIKELNKRQDKVKLAENWIMDYIKKVVFPQLQIGYKKSI